MVRVQARVRAAAHRGGPRAHCVCEPRAIVRVTSKPCNRVDATPSAGPAAYGSRPCRGPARRDGSDGRAAAARAQRRRTAERTRGSCSGTPA